MHVSNVKVGKYWHTYAPMKPSPQSREQTYASPQKVALCILCCPHPLYSNSLFMFFFCWVVFHCIYILHFIHTVTHPQTFGLFSGFCYCTWKLVRTFLNMSSCGCMFSFLLDVHLEWNYWVYMFLELDSWSVIYILE